MEISVSVGEEVEDGDLLVVIESMKMENEIISEYDAQLRRFWFAKTRTYLRKTQC